MAFYIFITIADWDRAALNGVHIIPAYWLLKLFFKTSSKYKVLILLSAIELDNKFFCISSSARHSRIFHSLFNYFQVSKS